MSPVINADGSLTVYHPTKGYRRISAARVRARAKMQRVLGIAAANTVS